MADVTTRLSTALADRYRLERELGAGGMATVYLAEDLRHERKVAVKVLRPDLAAALGPERFLREIKLAAQLEHPHILPLLDSGEADGFLYYVMPYIEGESLREKLAREGELPINEAVRILREVVDALSHAHEKGIVHRDIKPDNVMLSGRHARVMDFGVAKAVSEATGALQITTAGVALGTPSYMAPEQATADPHVDHRADVYAVGVLGYELVAGRPPFTGSSPQEILAAHVTQAPAPVTSHRSTVPPALERLLMRCLEKKPADRWQTAEELLPQLEALTTPSGGITPAQTQPVEAAERIGRPRRVIGAAVVAVLVLAAATVAVLRWQGQSTESPLDTQRVLVVPLENGTGLPELDGVGSLIEAQLVQGLQQTGLSDVLGSRTAMLDAPLRDTSQAYVSSPVGARALAGTVGAGILFTGRYLTSGDSLQVELSLVDLTELAEAARIPVSVISRTPSAAELTPLRERAMGALAVFHDSRWGIRYVPGVLAPTYTAYRIYFSAVEHFDRAEYDSAATKFLAAVAADSSFLIAAVRAAYAFSNAGEPRSVDSIAAALGSRRAALGEYESAYLARVVDWNLGDYEDALRQAEAMARLAPKSPYAAYLAARSQIPVNRQDAAARDLRRLDMTQPELPVSQVYRDIAWALHLLGRYEEELQVARESLAHPRNNRPIVAKSGELRALIALGRADEAMSMLADLLARRAEESPGAFALNVAREFVWHGFAEEGTETLTRAHSRLRDEGNAQNRLLALVMLRQLDDAAQLADSLPEAQPGDWRWEGWHGAIAALRGDRVRAEAAVAMIGEVREPYLRGSPKRVMGEIRALLGDVDEALRYLREAFAEGVNFQGDINYHGNWFLLALQDHPGFRDFVQPKE